MQSANVVNQVGQYRNYFLCDVNVNMINFLWNVSVDIFSYGSHLKLLWTSTQTEGHTLELVTCSAKVELMKSTLVRTLILRDLASEECPFTTTI